MATTLTINGEAKSVNTDPDTPLLWVLRDELGLTGTKYGCGIAQCGACTVHIDGQPSRACITPLRLVDGKTITTIEGATDAVANAVQQAWATEVVPQCGFCQSGQVMSAVGLLSKTAKPTDADIDASMSGNLCRCATYPRIRKAIHTAAKTLATKNVSLVESNDLIGSSNV